MTISVICPACGRQFAKIKSELAGKMVRCTCGKSLRLPDPKPTGTDPANSLAQRSVDQNQNSSSNTAGSATVPKTVASNARNPFEIHYSDLDLILNKSGNSDSDFDPRATAQKNSKAAPSIAWPPDPPDESASPPSLSGTAYRSKLGPASAGNSTGPDKAGSSESKRISFLFGLAMVSSFVAFGFAMFLLSARMTSANLIWQGTPDETLRQIYAGQFGMETMSAGTKLGFKLLGWVIVAIAFVLLLVASLQMLNAGIQLFASLSLFCWIDGLMATLAVTMLALFIGTIFLHGSHTQYLKRRIDQATVVTDGEEPANIQRLRAQVRSDTEQFQWTIAGICAAPATIFGCSMLRLLARV